MALIPDIASEFLPGIIGGIEDWSIQVNRNSSGSVDPGEIWVSGTYYTHPNGTTYSIPSTNSSGTTELILRTTFGDALSTTGKGWLMWSATPILTRFPTWSWAAVVDELPTYICGVIFRDSAWYAVDNNNTQHSFTPVEGDVLIAEVEGGATNLGITRFIRYSVNDSGLTNTLATNPPAQNDLVCERTGFVVSVSEGLKKEWTGRLVRQSSWEPRHQQDFVRAMPEHQRGSPAPERQDQFVEDIYGADGVSVDDLG